MPTRRQFLRSAAAAVAAGGFHPRHARCSAEEPARRPSTLLGPADVPVTGRPDPNLAPFDDLMTGFVTEHRAPGAALAITRHGKLVYARGFGFADREKKTPVAPDALFRIASVSKPFTAVAVLRLAEQKKLRLDDPVLAHLKLDPPPGTTPDPRWKDITIRHCLQHTGGWDRDKSGDPIDVPEKIAKELDIPFPVPPEAVVRYVTGRPLDFDPGARYAYSNVGYLVLARVIEAASGEKYELHVRKHVLAPLGITRMQLGRALPENRPAAEVRYYDHKNRTARCVYPPRVGQQVPVADGAMNLEGFEAHGGWIASAVDLVRFARAFDDPARCPVLSADSIRTTWQRPEGAAGANAKGKPRAVYYGCGWQVRPTGAGGVTTWHTGLLVPGTSSILSRRWDGLNWAILFNTDAGPDGKPLADATSPLVFDAADSIERWPDTDLFDNHE
jgi:N-acyl-D-amino-acid deacylase